MADLSVKIKTDGLDEAAAKTKLFEGHSRELRKTIRELGREFPIAGLLLRAFANPIGAALSIGISAFVAIKRHVDNLNKSLDELEANARQPLSNFAEALREIQRAASETDVADAFKNFDTAIASIHTKADAAVVSIHALETAQKELFSAKEAMGLAKINLQETQGVLTPVQAIQARQKVRDSAAKEQKTLADAARAAEIGTRESEISRTQQKITEAQGAVLPPTEEARKKALAKTRADDAERFRKLAAEGLFDEAGAGATAKTGKTLDQTISELSTKIDDLAAARTRTQAAGILAPGNAAEHAAHLKYLDDERNKLITERDAVQSRKSGLLQTAKHAEDLAQEYKNSVTVSEEARKALEKLNKELADLKVKLEALKEDARLYGTKGAETEAAKKSTRAYESDDARIKAIGEEMKKDKAERRRKGTEADQEIRSGQASPDVSAVVQPVVDELAAAGSDIQGMADLLITGVKAFRAEVADAKSRLGDSFNT